MGATETDMAILAADQSGRTSESNGIIPQLGRARRKEG